MITTAGLRGDHPHSKTVDLAKAVQCQKVPIGNHWADNTVATAHVDVTAHTKGICLRALYVDFKTGWIHQRISLHIANCQMDAGVKRRISGELACTKETKETNATRCEEHDVVPGIEVLGALNHFKEINSNGETL